MTSLRFALVATAFLAVPTAAQSPNGTGTPVPSPAERATVARDAWRRAGASQRAQLADSMWADMNRAHAAWPAQVAYSEMVARQAARRNDAVSLERVLRRLAAQGMGAGAAADTTVARVAATTPGAAEALASVKRAVAPIEASKPRELLADTAYFPEGIDVDPSDGTLYITSIHHRTVRAFKRDGTSRVAIKTAPGEIAGAFGVAVDRARGVLWVTTGGIAHMKDFTPADSARAELLRVTLSDGSIEQRWKLGDGTGTPGEIALDPAGDVLVSDAIKGKLYRLRGGKGALATIESPLLRSPQGIAPSADGTIAYVADWSHGILRWDLRTDQITAVSTPDDVALLGIDGLRRSGTRLIGVQNGATPARVVSITLDAAGTSVRSVATIDRPKLEGEPTVGTIAGDKFVYVSSALWPFRTDAGAARPGAGPQPVVTVREVALPR